MKRLIIALIAIILSSLLLPSVSAKSSDIFIDYLTNMMWEDCQGNDIHINQPVIKIVETNQSVSLIKWPYNYSTLRKIVEIFGDEQHIFTTIIGGTCEDNNNERNVGCGILTCGDNRLDINGYNYFWNGIKVDVPQQNFNIKTTYGPNSSIIETHGEKSPVTTGSNSPINQQEDSIWIQLFWPKITILGMIVGALITILTELIAKYFKK